MDIETTQQVATHANEYGSAGWGVLITGAVAAFATVLRKQIRGVSSDAVAVTQDNTQRETLGQLRSEIKRLERLVIRMQHRHEAFEQRNAAVLTAVLAAQRAVIGVERSMIRCDCVLVEQHQHRLSEVMDMLTNAADEITKPYDEEEDEAEVCPEAEAK